MGLDIKRNRAGLYKVKSTISDEELGDGWISEDEIKKLLIERAYFKFIENVIRIDMEFPSGYYVNNKMKIDDKKHVKGSEFIIKNWSNGDAIEDEYRSICERLKIEL